MLCVDYLISLKDNYMMLLMGQSISRCQLSSKQFLMEKESKREQIGSQGCFVTCFITFTHGPLYFCMNQMFCHFNRGMGLFSCNKKNGQSMGDCRVEVGRRSRWEPSQVSSQEMMAYVEKVDSRGALDVGWTC